MDPVSAIGLGITVLKVFMGLVMMVKQTNNKVILFKSELADLSKTLTAMRPAIEQLGQLNNELGLPKDELNDLIEIMEQGTELVKESSNIFILDFVNMFYQGRNLRRLNASLDCFFKYRMQTLIARDVKQVAATVRTIHEKLTIMESSTSVISASASDPKTSASAFVITLMVEAPRWSRHRRVYVLKIKDMISLLVGYGLVCLVVILGIFWSLGYSIQ